MLCSLAAVLLCVAQVAELNAQTQGVLDAAPPSGRGRPPIPTTGSASVSGTVVADDTGILLANARVSLSSDYYAVAFDDVPDTEIMDPEYLFLARRKASRLSVGQGEAKPLTLRVVSITK